MGLGDANTTPHGSVGVTTEPCEAIHDKTCIRAFALARAATAGRPIARFRARRAQRATLTSRALADSSMHARELRVRAPLMRAMASAEETQAAPQKAHAAHEQQARIATHCNALRRTSRPRRRDYSCPFSTCVAETSCQLTVGHAARVSRQLPCGRSARNGELTCLERKGAHAPCKPHAEGVLDHSIDHFGALICRSMRVLVGAGW